MASTTFDLDEIPQANDLTKVGQAVIAVSLGKSTFQEIAKHIGFTERQGRYYRRAAEILNLISLHERNKSELTATGQQFIASVKQGQGVIQAIKPSLLSIPLLREVYERVAQSKAVDEDDILECLIELSGVKKSNITIVRRLSTFVSWLKQVGLLEQVEDKKSFKLLPFIVGAAPAAKIALDENQFYNDLTTYLYVPKQSEDTDWQAILQQYKALKSKDEKKAWLEKEEVNQRFARYMIGISSKEEVLINDLDRNLLDFDTIDTTHARLLIERSRSLKFITKSIGSGGTALEDKIAAWLTSKKLTFKRSHLLPNSEKNVDFYVESLQLAIESKYSKTSGTKHSGALHDLIEISKAKTQIKNLLLGVAIAGEGFEETFFESLETLYNKGQLDFILPVQKIESTDPGSIKRDKTFIKPTGDSLVFKSSVGMSWSEPLSDQEQGLYDAAYWLKKYSAVSYISFQARLQTWINQTPFAIECLRLILGWSETQMSNFILTSVPDGADMLRDGEINPDHVSLLVAGLNSKIADEELREISSFFDSMPTINDFISARIESFDGVARKKRNTSKIFIEMCKMGSPYKVIDESVDLTLADTTNLQSNFSIIDDTGATKHVLCKYYAGDGSVMSDLVKKIENLASSPNGKDWLVIVDGAGWKKRNKDLRRLLAITKDLDFTVYNYSLWKGIKSKSG